MRKLLKSGIVPLMMVLSLTLGSNGGVLQVRTGEWAPAANLLEARTNSTATLLQDGRVLIAGGSDATGNALATAELFGADGSISPAATMNFARSRHFAVVLQDGRVLVAGGTGTNGMPLFSAEIFDPVANSWSPAASGMAEARAGAAGVLLGDGRVVISGGDSGSLPSMTIEIFDPVTGMFSPAGAMSTPRAKHAMVVLSGGRVMMLGGWNGSQVLQTTDIFDPNTGESAPGPQLLMARMSHTATTAIDGRVVIAGGTNGSIDLNSVEIFDPLAGVVTAGPNLATARRGQLAVLLPNNNNILFVGGTSAGVPVAAAEMYSPWQGTMTSAGVNAVARSQASASGTGEEGALLVSGGADAKGAPLNGNELYGFATVKTDANDYAPGTTVTITGTGWQPGETVTLSLVESPNFDTHPVMTEVADASGNFVNTDFSPDAHDLNVRFFLTAVGSNSGLQAQNTFTDGTASSLSGIVRSKAAGNPVVPGVTITCFSGCNNTPQATTTSNANGVYVFDSTTTKLSFATNGPVTLILTAVAPGYLEGVISIAGVNNGATITGKDFLMTPITTATSTTLTSSLNPSTFGQSVTFTAKVLATSGVSAPTGSVQFKVDGTVVGGAATVSPCNPSPNACVSFTSSTLNAGNQAIEADFTGTGVFTNSVGTLSGGQTVRQATPTVSVSFGSSPIVFDGNPHAAAATVTGVNGAVLGAGDGSLAITYLKNGAAFSGTPTDAGSYSASAVFTSANPNYTGANSATNASLTINPKTPTVSVSFDASSITFDGNPHTATAKATGVNGSTLGASDGSLVISYTKNGNPFGGNPKDAATYTASASFTSSNPDYANASSAASASLTISAAQLTAIIIGNPTKPYDGNTSATLTPANFSLSGLMGSDSFNVTKTGGLYNSKDVATASAVNVALGAVDFSPNGATLASNYVLPTSASGPGSITPLTVAASIIGNPTKPFDGNSNATLTPANFSLAGVLAGESISVNQSSGTYNSPNVATANSVSATLGVANFAPAAGTLLSNYTLPTSATGPGQITPAATSVSVAASANPSTFGQMVTFTATVTNSSTGATPTGSVQFVVDGVNFGSPMPISGGGNSATTTMSLASLNVNGSPHSVKAIYSNGDGNFMGSNGSLSGGQTVSKAATSTSVQSSLNPSVFGQLVAFTATVTNTATGAAPTGSVQFIVDGASFGLPISLSGSGNSASATSGSIATLSVAGSPHYVDVQYSNSDGNFSNSSGGTNQSINKANTSTTVSTSVSPSTLNQSVTFTATVVDSTPMSTGNPTGSMNFYDGENLLGSGSISGGQATYSTSALAVGSHQITAQYMGDSNFNSSTSAAIAQQVQYSFAILYDPTRAVNGNAAYPIKIYAADANGKDVSSPSLVLHATLVVSGGFSAPPSDAGNSNPGSNFRFDNGFGPNGGYMFNLKTTGLPSGTYLLQFTAGNDPIVHAVGFAVK